MKYASNRTLPNGDDEDVTKTAHAYWKACLKMRFAYSRNKTRLVSTEREGPLSVQRAFYPENSRVAHLYLLHPPAGIVSGDVLNIEAHLQADNRVLLTTPGANRFYRARTATELASKQKQNNLFFVEKGSSLEYLPHETLIYSAANAFSDTKVMVRDTGCFMGWDIACLGFPHIDRPFASGQFTQTFSLYHNDTILFHDRLAVVADDNITRSRIGLNGSHVTGTMVLFNGEKAGQSAWLKSVCNTVRQETQEEHQRAEVAVTQIQGVIVIRYLGDESEACRQTFVRIWSALRAVFIGLAPHPPRIWYT